VAEILNDAELKRLIGKVIVNGDEACIRPNSYVLRLGGEGEFISTGKEFKLAENGKKKGVKLAPGHAIGMTAMETLDFRRETVEDLFPDSDLHAFLSPTTDLSREGVVAPTTQVDAGYFGTLNWTLTNSSSIERRFTIGERIYRLTVLKLAKGERPDRLYDGQYQSRTGYVRSQRKGAPVGMKESEWEDGFEKEGPEAILDNLISAGYPWNRLGEQFRLIDQQFKTVTNEYGEIRDSIESMNQQMALLKEKQSNVADVVREVLRGERQSLRNDTLVSVGTVLALMVGMGLTIHTSPALSAVVSTYGAAIGIGIIVAAVGVAAFSNRRR
jgi:deoxycytidine triphosphate deaminase